MSYTYESMDKGGFEWFCSHLPIKAIEDSCGIVARSSSGVLAGGAVFDNFTDTSCQVSFLILENMLLRDQFFDKCATLLFCEFGLKMCHVLIPSSNRKSLNFVMKMGFIEQARLKGAFKEGVDYVILELRKENCDNILAEVS